MKILKQVFIIIIVSLVFGLIFNHFSEDGVNPFAGFDANIDVSKDARCINDFDEILTYFSMDSAVFIDTRDRKTFASGHIPEALNAPYYYMERAYGMIGERLLTAEVIILYGQDAKDIAPVRTADYYQELGDRKLLILYGGYEKWVESGMPIDKKEQK